MTVYLVNDRKDKVTEYPDRAAAEEQRSKLIELGMSPENVEIKANDPTETKADGGKAETHSVEVEDTEVVSDKEIEETTKEVETQELPEEKPGVDTDPLDWVPSDFVDRIDGTPAINRKGYDVLAHHYDISVTTEVLVSPSETGYEYAEVVATAITDDGVTYAAHGSAHISRGDDEYLLLEMADTRAAKRATARATGVGMVAVQELQNEL